MRVIKYIYFGFGLGAYKGFKAGRPHRAPWRPCGEPDRSPSALLRAPSAQRRKPMLVSRLWAGPCWANAGLLLPQGRLPLPLTPAQHRPLRKKAEAQRGSFSFVPSGLSWGKGRFCLVGGAECTLGLESLSPCHQPWALHSHRARPSVSSLLKPWVRNLNCSA